MLGEITTGILFIPLIDTLMIILVDTNISMDTYIVVNIHHSDITAICLKNSAIAQSLTFTMTAQTTTPLMPFTPTSEETEQQPCQLPLTICSGAATSTDILSGKKIRIEDYLTLHTSLTH